MIYFYMIGIKKIKAIDYIGYRHPMIASKNAKEICSVNEEVIKIIESHMWPLTITKIPKTKEAMLVCLVDKLLATRETINFRKVTYSFFALKDFIANQLYIIF